MVLVLLGMELVVWVLVVEVVEIVELVVEDVELVVVELVVVTVVPGHAIRRIKMSTCTSPEELRRWPSGTTLASYFGTRWSVVLSNPKAKCILGNIIKQNE